jgi:predicted RNA-binding Zn ribbon-like protein
LGKIAIFQPVTLGTARLHSITFDTGTRPAVDAKHPSVSAFSGDFCLSYINTLSWRGRRETVETLHTPADLVAWVGRSDVLDDATLEDARQWVTVCETEAAAWLASAIKVREALFGIFSAIATATPVDAECLRAFGTALAGVPSRDCLIATSRGFAWSLSLKKPAIDILLAPVLWSAGDLMVGTGADHVRRCSNDECLWLFIDQSKPNSRRWCDMGSCGNRAKARRHYARPHVRLSTGRPVSHYAGNEGCAGLAGAEPHA